MTDQSSTRRIQPAPNVFEKIYMENTLLRIAGALFCHDAKRAPTRTNEIELTRAIKEKTIVIRPDPRVGQPGPLAHKIFVAIIKKHSNYGRPVQHEVTFTKRELMRLIGRREWGGRDGEQLIRAINEIHYCFVRTSFKRTDGNFVEHSFSIFPEVYLERAESDVDPVETCMVTLARPIIESLQDQHFTCLNHILMQQLGTIGQAFYMRLFFHFANLFDGHRRGHLTFSKQYDDICAEWLGGLTVLKFKSTIEREQLGPHLRHLIQVGFLDSYHIAKATRGDSFLISFRPGAAFYVDYDRFYRRRPQGKLQYEFHDDRRTVAEPLKVAYLFLEKRTGQPVKSIPYVSTKEVDTAKQLLTQVSFEDVPEFLDYALTEAKKTKFDVQTLGGLKQYVIGYLAGRQDRATSKVAALRRQEKDQETRTRMEYDHYRRSAADALFSALPAEEQAAIEGQARALNGGRFAAGNGSLATTMMTLARARITADRHPERIPSYESWKETRRAA